MVELVFFLTLLAPQFKEPVVAAVGRIRQVQVVMVVLVVVAQEA